MLKPIESLLATGTKLWLDSIDPDLVRSNWETGATGATSNPIIVADLLATGRFDADIEAMVGRGLSDSDIAWQMTDKLVRDAQQVFLPAWEWTGGNDGYVSFEVDPLLEDPELNMDHAMRVSEYVRLGCEWAAGHRNRMIKVPATPAGLDAVEDLVAAGVTVNVTLIFTSRQYRLAREAVWRGAQRRENLDALTRCTENNEPVFSDRDVCRVSSRLPFKSVYSIFVSRLDVYTEKAVPQLSPDAQGMVGILNAKRIWAENHQFWAERETPLKQEIVFASTGTKKPSDPPWKYVAAFAGSDIQTNPPATNEAVAKSSCTFIRQVDQLPPASVIEEIDRLVDMDKLESTLMAEGIAKFANPQKSLLAMVAKKRAAVA